ncbi:DUF667 domain-containing protein [Trichonephila clavata]|uniref:DUF667 domain-containing protein n=1 Tax=Trichonephila clavata TaxID=2740835 RepID=A0A8X6I0V3_TRICU|nr:DUF667 domain-containing protein [Trichonephila clavata]
MRKRITLSTTLKNKRKTQLSVSFPLSIKQNFMWFHLFIDVQDAIFLSWKNEELKSIDSISIGEGNWFINYDQLPKEMSFSKNIPQTYFCVVCSEEMTDEKDDSESSQSCESDRTFSHSRFADNSWSSLTRSSGASFQLKPKSRKTPHTLLKKQNRKPQPSGKELIMEECDNTVVIREHDAPPLPDFSFRERNIPTDLNSIESTLGISPDILQQNADIVDQEQYEIFSNIEYVSNNVLYYLSSNIKSHNT